MKKILFILLFICLVGCSKEVEKPKGIDESNNLIATKNNVSENVISESYIFTFDETYICEKIKVNIIYSNQDIAQENYNDYKDNANTKGFSNITINNKTVSYNLNNSEYLGANKSDILNIMLENEYYISYN